MHWLGVLIMGLLAWYPLQPPTNLPRYSIHIDLDYDAHRLVAQQKVEFSNHWGEPLSELVFHVPSATVPQAFRLDTLSLNDAARPPLYRLQNGFLIIELPQPLAPGERVRVFLGFTVDLPPVQTGKGFVASSLGWSEIGLNVGHWHPVLAPYDAGRGWRTWQDSLIGDPYVTESADYEVDIVAPPHVMVAGGGEDLRQGNVWRYWLAGGREFGFIASHLWEEEKTEVGGVRVHSYFLPEHRQAGLAVLEAAAAALRFYSETLGAYPYRDFRIVETRSDGGMELPGFSYLTDTFYAKWPGTSRSSLVYTTVHEVAHQWWYNLVGNDQVYEPWLDEALADTFAWFFYRKERPDDAEWWWNTYVQPWSEKQPVDATIYQFADNSAYMHTVYRRGVRLFADVEKQMGERRLLAALRAYLYSHAYRLSTSTDLIAVLTRYADTDLASLWSTYLATPPWIPSCVARGERCPRRVARWQAL